MKDLIEKTVWTERYKNTGIEIIRSDPGTYFKRVREWDWFYYIYMYESYCKDFSSVWLPAELKKFSEKGQEYVTYAYYNLNIDMHCGMTYYAQHGQVEGHRSVQIGCDYQHYWDEGKEYSLPYVYSEAKDCAELCIERFYKTVSVLEEVAL